MSTVAERKRRAFLEGRRTYIGGTDVAAILGISPWSSPLQVWREKTNPVPETDGSSLAMRRGLALEDFIADEFTRAKPGLVTYRPKPVVRTDWGFPAGASVDRMVATTEHPRTPVAILEAKTAFKYGWRDWNEETGDLPPAYYVQQQWYLAVTELPLSYGAADIGDPGALRIIPTRPDRRIQRRCIEAAREFWERHVLTGQPPQPNGSDGDAAVLRDLYRDPLPDPAVPLDDPEAARLLRTYLEAKGTADSAKREAESAKQQLCALMGEHEKALVDGYLLTWKTQRRTTLDTKALRDAHPAIAGEFSRTTETRVFGTPKETK
mgnify:CR=1 FL=1